MLRDQIANVAEPCLPPDPESAKDRKIEELSGIPKVLLVTRRQPGAGPGRGGGEHLIR
jgi:hypothetical protein